MSGSVPWHGVSIGDAVGGWCPIDDICAPVAWRWVDVELSSYAGHVEDRDKPELVPAPPGELQGEPPVVARLVVEIRSDGSRTIARGALEDVASGQRTMVEARGDSPIQLAIALARSLTRLPRLGARSAIRGLLGKRRDH
jgi:hypothetical protein